jgi:hypothetical protein
MGVRTTVLLSLGRLNRGNKQMSLLEDLDPLGWSAKGDR